MSVLHVHADVEQLLVGWVPTVVTARAVTELPNDLTGQVPVVRIVRVGGPTGLPGFDTPTVVIDCFDVTRPAAKTLALQVQAAVEYQLPRFFNPYGTVLATECVSGPSWLPYDNTNVRRFSATYRMTMHNRT